MRLEDFFLRRRRPRPPRPQTVIARHIGKGIAALILAGGAALFGIKDNGDRHANIAAEPSRPQLVQLADSDENLSVAKAVRDRQELPFVEIKNARVVKLLRADNRGARHQRWVTQLSDGIFVTVTHNIDLAEKVPLSPGDILEMAGELVFDDKKGTPLLHWTHADPQGKRVSGYIVHNGKKYGALPASH